MKQLHGAVDFTKTDMVLGIPDAQGNAALLINDLLASPQTQHSHRISGSPVAAFVGGVTYEIMDGTLIDEHTARWSHENISDYIAHPRVSGILYLDIVQAIKDRVELVDENHYRIIALWIIMTYFTPLFDAVPFILLLGPKASGKSQLLGIMEALCFNAEKLQSVTPAALVNLTAQRRCTLLIDQAENIKSTLVGMLADSYKKNGGRYSCIEKRKGVKVAIQKSSYGPKAFGTTKELDRDLLDRCIKIPMRKGKAKTYFTSSDPIWAKLRNECYRLLLHQWYYVRAANKLFKHIFSREDELLKPLKCVAHVANLPVGHYADMVMAVKDCLRGTQVTVTNAEAALIESLADMASSSTGQEFDCSAPDLLAEVCNRVPDKNEHPSPSEMGHIIKRYSLAMESKKRGRKKVTHYRVDRANALNVAKLYLQYAGETHLVEPTKPVSSVGSTQSDQPSPIVATAQVLQPEVPEQPELGEQEAVSLQTMEPVSQGLPLLLTYEQAA